VAGPGRLVQRRLCGGFGGVAAEVVEPAAAIAIRGGVFDARIPPQTRSRAASVGLVVAFQAFAFNGSLGHLDPPSMRAGEMRRPGGGLLPRTGRTTLTHHSSGRERWAIRAITCACSSGPAPQFADLINQASAFLAAEAPLSRWPVWRGTSIRILTRELVCPHRRAAHAGSAQLGAKSTARWGCEPRSRARRRWS
jgi:hypothetical protein